jgi:hypothetical protein
LIAGAPAFNSVSRSSLLLAQHPEHEDVRVLVRGKGNLSQTPTAVEFRIGEHRFEANGHEFKVPLAQNFQVGDLTVDDLLDTSIKADEHSKVADVCEIIEALLPRDREWHPAKPIYEACAQDDIDERTVKRGKARLHVEHRRTKTFPAVTEWRWPITEQTARTAVGPRALAVPTVPTVPTGNSRKPLRGTSEDTQDGEDTQTIGPHCGPTVAELSDDDLLAIFPGSVLEAA